MNLKSITVPTRIAKAGMTAREVFEECNRANTPGLPFCDANGQVTGRITIKHILKRYCLPDYLIEMAAVLGEQISNVQDMELMAKNLLDSPIDDCVQRTHIASTSASSAIKVLALMEKTDTGYIFVIDDEKYQGVVTLHKLCEAILQIDA